MRKRFFITIFVLISVSVYLFYKALTDTYMLEQTYACQVLSKIDHNYESHIKGVSYDHRDFILVLSSENKRFSLDVNPTTWGLCKEGDTLFFDIPPYKLDIYQGVPVRWSFWACIVTFANAVFISLLLIISSNVKKVEKMPIISSQYVKEIEKPKLESIILLDPLSDHYPRFNPLEEYFKTNHMKVLTPLEVYKYGDDKLKKDIVNWILSKQ